MIPSLQTFALALTTPELSLTALLRTTRFAETEIIWKNERWRLAMPLSAEAAAHAERISAAVRRLNSDCLVSCRLLSGELRWQDVRGELRRCDLVIETAGTEITTRQAIHMAKKGASLVLVGYSKTGEMNLPMSLVLDKELTFKTVFRYRHIYPMAIDAVAAGKVNLKGIVTNIFDFDDIQEAMDKSVSDKANIVKAVVKIAKEG